jgi:hypothetical protein
MNAFCGTMKIVRPRTCTEVRVGDNQSVEVLIHIRRKDISWFNSNPSTHANATELCTENNHHNNRRDSNNTNNEIASNMFAQLLDIIEKSILPRMFADEIESNYYKALQQQQIGRDTLRLPPELGWGGIPINEAMKSISTQKFGPSILNVKKKVNQRRRNVLSKVQQAEMKRLQLEAIRMQKKNEKDVFYATNLKQTMYVMYRLEVIQNNNATLIFRNDGDDDSDNNNNNSCNPPSLLALKKLQRRILVWCYPRNNEMDKDRNKNNTLCAGSAMIPNSNDMHDEGFFRPELIPISTFFR